MKQNRAIKWLGGRKFIIAEQILLIAFVATLADKMTPTLAGILAGVGVAYGAFNYGTKFLSGKGEA